MCHELEQESRLVLIKTVKHLKTLYSLFVSSALVSVKQEYKFLNQYKNTYLCLYATKAEANTWQMIFVRTFDIKWKMKFNCLLIKYYVIIVNIIILLLVNI